MKQYLILLIASLFTLASDAQINLNVDLVKQIDRGSTSYSGSWVYTDDLGAEYGLVGSASGIAIYPLEEGNDDLLAFIPGPSSRWREITVIKDHAYVTTEGNGVNQGLQVINLGGLPDTAFLVTTFDSTFTRGHILQKDIFNPDEPYIYISGTDSTGGVHILDVSDPMNPMEVGRHDPPDYIHDVHIRDDRMYTFQFNVGVIQIVDISDKTNPVLITSINDPGGSTHSGWTTEDNNFLLVADEKDGFDGRVFDIRDLNNIFEVSTFTSNPNAFVHNPYVRGDFAYLAHNREGLRVYDVVDPSNPIEVGYYDTVTEENPQSGGLWSACPYIPSGKVIGGDRDLGLFVWEINEVYASRFSGIVKDRSTLETLDGVEISIVEKADTLFTNGFGTYKGGYPMEGNITLRFSLEGYIDVVQALNLDINQEQINEILMETGINVSTRDLQNNTYFELSPNPADQFIKIELNASAEIEAHRFVLNTNLGKAVKQRSINGSQTYTIGTEDIPAGVYILTLLNKENQLIARQKLIVQH